MKKPIILGLSGSLRNARRGKGNENLLESIRAAKTEGDLQQFIEQEAAEHLKAFEQAGRTDGLPFDQLYTNLKKNKGNKGLSNSEVLLTTALWSAWDIGCEIDHISLAEFFPESGDVKQADVLKKKLAECDGVLLSTPVYFGDRSSLVQTFFNWLKQEGLLESIKGKPFAGTAVGAKRNGGQETTLIYQLFDALQMGFLGLGNDSETTSQYGGTGHAGDIGIMPQDEYGLNTAKGTGRRIARVVLARHHAQQYKLTGKPKIAFWLVQDNTQGGAQTFVRDLIAQHDDIDADIVDIAGKHIMRCIACDICPTSIDKDEVYRCIIKSPKDNLKELHEHLLGYDAIIPVAYSGKNRNEILSNYQKFQERTRYFRRGDYVFSDVLSAPLIVEELGANENLAVRMMTSMVRHHTVLSKPLLAFKHNGAVLNNDEVSALFNEFIDNTRIQAIARLRNYSDDEHGLKYNPVGYVLSAVKDVEDQRLNRRRDMVEGRKQRADADFAERVSIKPKVS